jgi:bifunctional UDP-N-acetylglucosamine pyrophosphorylase/glucosamine-1-phosphate N-acetyltransferase
MNRIALVLAAGEGKRMKSKIPKVLHRLKGKTLIERVLDAIDEAGFDRTILIVGHGGEEVRRTVGHRGVEFAWQHEQKGTGHAVLQAAPLLSDVGGSLVVLSGDVPLIRPSTLRDLACEHEKSLSASTIVTAEFEDPTGYGRIVRGDSGGVERIVEQKDAKPEELAIKEINSGTYCFAVSPLLEVLPKLGNDNASGEYYLTDVIGRFRERDLPVAPYVVGDVWEIFGINTAAHLKQAARHIDRGDHG